jgi:hypothetical protein
MSGGAMGDAVFLGQAQNGRHPAGEVVAGDLVPQQVRQLLVQRDGRVMIKHKNWGASQARLCAVVITAARIAVWVAWHRRRAPRVRALSDRLVALMPGGEGSPLGELLGLAEWGPRQLVGAVNARLAGQGRERLRLDPTAG